MPDFTSPLAIYQGEPLPRAIPSIYLAGPTQTGEGQEHWHDTALRILTSLRYQGAVILPTPREGKRRIDEEQRIRWQLATQNVATVIVFWVPHPTLETYLEFGSWCRRDPRKLILGLPTGDHEGLIGYYGREARVRRVYELLHALQYAVQLTAGQG